MKKSLLRIASLIAVLAMSTSMMAACSSGNDSSSSKTEEGKSESSTGDSNFNETGYPIVNDPVTLKVLASKHSLTDPYPELQIFQDLEKKTNVKIDFQYGEGEDWNTQKPLLLASGDLPDVFLGPALSESDVSNNIDLFLPMDEYITKYCPNIQKMFDESAEMKQMATLYDGMVYGLPHQMPCRPETFDMGFINQQWLDNLGLKMPTTTEELHNVLKAFKEKDANGNGDANDEIPMSFMAFNDLTGCLSLFGSFGVVDSLNSKYLTVTDGKVEYAPTLDGFKEGTKFLTQLYKDGLVDVEAFTHDWSMYPAKLNPEGDSKVGVGFHWSIQTGVGLDRSKEYTPLMPVKGPNGDQYWRKNPQSVKAGKYYAEVTKNTKTPEVAMRWVDAIYDQETSMQFFYGPIGKTVEKSEDGKYTVLPPTDGLNAESWAWKFSMGDQCPGYSGDAFCENVTPPADVQEKLDADKEYAKYLKEEYYPLVTLTKEQSDELSTLGTDLNKFFQETISGWIVNGANIDKEWDTYVAQMEKMGSPRYVEIYQEAYDSYKK